jgi:hypothetical protein
MAPAKSRKPKSTASKPASLSARVMKAMGLLRLDAFRRADLTSELRKAASLTAEDEHRLTAFTELRRLGLPAEVAEALALSGAIGSASAFASLTLAELEQLLREEPVVRLLPPGFRIDAAAIEAWIALARPLSADEDAPGRSAVAETTAATLGRDDDVSHVTEDLVLSAEQLDGLLTSIQQTWSRTEATLKGLARPRTRVDGAAVRGAVAGLQGGVADALDRIASPIAGGFVAVDEAGAGDAADEGLDPSIEVQRLQAELIRIEATIDALRASTTSGSEEASAAVATEAGVSERETSERGE